MDAQAKAAILLQMPAVHSLVEYIVGGPTVIVPVLHSTFFVLEI
jgi:hypothetical protein